MGQPSRHVAFWKVTVMKYELLKIVLRVAKQIAKSICTNPSPGAANHLIKDALGDIKAL